MYSRVLLAILCLFASIMNSHAQISNNSQAPQVLSDDINATADPSALLDVQASDKGVLVPRMTAAQRDAISPAAQGLLIYVTDTNSFWHFDGNGWVEIDRLQSSVVDGDGDTRIQVDQGADEDQIVYTLGGNERMRLRLNANSDARLEMNTTATRNTIIGLNAGTVNTGTDNTFLGYQSGFVNTTGDANVFLGLFTGSSNQQGGRNTFVGTSSGTANVNGFENTYVGKDAGRNSINASNNTIIGHKAGFSVQGNFNTIVGEQAGQQLQHPSGTQNVFVGRQSGQNVSVGGSNIYLGVLAGSNNMMGSGNVGLGTAAGQGNDGNFNVFLGNNAGASAMGSNQLFIDNSNTNTPLIYGKFDTDEVTINGMLTVSNNVAVTGSVSVVGDICATGSIGACSDKRYKRNILPLTNALSAIQQIHGVSYYWKQMEFPQMQFSDREQIGILAQDVERVFPQMVLTGADGYKRVDYTRLTPVLLEAVKEQQTQINALKAENEQMKKDIQWLMQRSKQ